MTSNYPFKFVRRAFFAGVSLLDDIVGVVFIFDKRRRRRRMNVIY